jgi:hypothetical protein
MKSKHDLFISDYECEEKDLCPSCIWYNGEQCNRQLLTEEDIEKISKEKEL